jgi:predicted phage baseplate assembly protein
VRSGGVRPADALLLAFAERADAFGWNAPDPTFVPGSETGPDGDWTDLQIGATVGHEGTVDLDGDHARVEVDSWIVLRAPTASELYRVTSVAPGGAVLHGLSGRITRISVDPVSAAPHDLTSFGRRETVVLCRSRVLPTGEAPRRAAAGGRDLELVATDPPLPPGRRVLVTGSTPRPEQSGAVGSPQPVCEPAIVVSTAAGTADPAIMTITLDRPLAAGIDPQTLRVLGNIAGATHGETVRQVLGSGDGRVPFAEFRPARGPLTYVRDTTPSGARSTLQLRVDGVAWTEVASLHTAAAHDRVFTVHADEDGAVRLVLGDGTHGARPSTGTENVAVTYRVGIGEPGTAAAGQLTLLTRRPLGIRAVTNPAPARDWAPPETLDDARRNAPLRIRTLDRAVSVADHGDFAAAFAGVGIARADEVWDGRVRTVVVSLLGAAGTSVSGDLLADLGTALAAARDPGSPLRLLGGELRWYGIRVELRTDPAYSRPAVEQSVRDRLTAQLSPAAGAFAAPVTAAAVLVRVRAVAGVVACTMPRLLLLPGWGPPVPGIAPQLPDDTAAAVVLAALPARFEAGAVQPAQLLALAPGGVAIGVLRP